MSLQIEKKTTGRLPTFLVIGAMKAGTTSLYHYLKAHPQIYVPPYKAPEFFVAESNLHRGINWYRKQFAGAGREAVAIGEVANAYAKYPKFAGVPERIAAHIPNARLIYIVRDPIARILSHYRTRFAEGTEEMPLEEAVFSNSIYLDYSKYAMQIEQYLKYVSREQMLVITAEALRNDRQQTVQAVYDFLGVDATLAPSELDREFYQTKDRAVRSPIPLWLRKGLKKHLPIAKRFKELENNTISVLRKLRGRADGEPEKEQAITITPNVREKLIELLRADVQQLRNYMGPDFDGWGIG
jgi:Sulfotransferase domain